MIRTVLAASAAMLLMSAQGADGQDAFRYHKAGSLKPKTGSNAVSAGDNATGVVDDMMRFPIEAAPAFANTQVFGKGGNCYGRGARCPYDLVKFVNGEWQVKFPQNAPENFKYPWRDNFCEERGAGTFLCMSGGGTGHQGQDIRPRTAEADKYFVVAVRDGTVSWQTSNVTVLRVVQPSSGPSYRIRYIYRHVNPNRKLVTSGSVSKERRLAYVSNFQGSTRQTTVHLHFEIEMPFVHNGKARIGTVNPYRSLVKAYERLLNESGTEVVE